mmetsp:Transcript_11304/g.69796  ORF Transcript_11304/g.69796 Transcript_11304/m.69796 type:complete len:242 (+) Transcript_11304:373-1098(+)
MEGASGRETSIRTRQMEDLGRWKRRSGRIRTYVASTGSLDVRGDVDVGCGGVDADWCERRRPGGSRAEQGFAEGVRGSVRRRRRPRTRHPQVVQSHRHRSRQFAGLGKSWDGEVASSAMVRCRFGSGNGQSHRRERSRASVSTDVDQSGKQQGPSGRAGRSQRMLSDGSRCKQGIGIHCIGQLRAGVLRGWERRRCHPHSTAPVGQGRQLLGCTSGIDSFLVGSWRRIAGRRTVDHPARER